MKLITLLFAIAIFPIASFSQTTTIKLFFSNEKNNPNMEDCRKVEAVTRKIPKTKAIAKAALEELFKGVNKEEEAKGFSFFSPEEMKGILKSINIKNKAAYINFNNNVFEQMGNATSSCGGAVFFSGLETTLKQFPNIKKFYYAIEGKPADFYDWVQVGECPKELKNCSGKNFIN